MNRSAVIEKAQEYFRAHHVKKPFRPGEDYVPVSGKVCDEEDLAYLIDASLDMWLTTGRFAKEFEEKLADFLGVRYALLTNSG